jgi:hypothetical protein
MTNFVYEITNIPIKRNVSVKDLCTIFLYKVNSGLSSITMLCHLQDLSFTRIGDVFMSVICVTDFVGLYKQQVIQERGFVNGWW